MPKNFLMGFDVGTFSAKGVLCTSEGEIVAQHQVEHGLSVPRPGWAEQDADGVWWGDLCQITRALLQKAQVDAAEVAALAISALGADVVPLDAQQRCLRPAILYGVDTRSTQEVADLNAQYGEDHLASTAGHRLTTQSIGPKILWLRRHEPEIWRQTRYLCSASTFLVLRLTGEYVFDYPTAGFYDPLFDLPSLTWHANYVAAIVGDVPLPRLQWVGELAGTITAAAARDTGLAVGTPVTAGTLDAVAEAISVGVTSPGDLMLMYGTTTFFINVVDQLPPPDSILWHTPYFAPGLYALEAGTATTGAATRWFRDQFAQPELATQAAGGAEAYSVLTAEAARVPLGSGGLVILPYFSGERTPINDPQARGLIAGLDLSHTRGHLYRAMLEATAYAVAHNLEALRQAGAAPKRIVAVGGGAKSDLLLQIVSDVAGIEQTLPAQTIGASYGDAFIAGLACGLLSLADLPANWVKPRRRFAPDEQRHGHYQEFYQVYRDLYLHARTDLHTLAQLATR